MDFSPGGGTEGSDVGGYDLDSGKSGEQGWTGSLRKVVYGALLVMNLYLLYLLVSFML